MRKSTKGLLRPLVLFLIIFIIFILKDDNVCFSNQYNDEKKNIF